MAALFQQELALGLGLHTFCHDGQPKTAAQLDDGAWLQFEE